VLDRTAKIGARVTVSLHAYARRGRMACMSDPFGNGFDLIELGPEGYEMLT
jgi:hypothetical protein